MQRKGQAARLGRWSQSYRGSSGGDGHLVPRQGHRPLRRRNGSL